MIIVSQSNPIINIKKSSNNFTVHWAIGKRCNFKCSYCPDNWHDDSSPHLTLKQLIQAWEKIVQLNPTDTKYDLSFLGGEPTLNKDFLPFLKWLHTNFKDNLINVGLITNGTASSSYYQKIVMYCNWITFSTHSEFMNEQKFFKNVLDANISSKKYKCMVNVNIMNESWHQHRNAQYKDFLDQNGISNYIHPIIDTGKNQPHFPVRVTNKIDFT
jgi:organic radical activating enzyme